MITTRTRTYAPHHIYQHYRNTTRQVRRVVSDTSKYSQPHHISRDFGMKANISAFSFRDQKIDPTHRAEKVEAGRTDLPENDLTTIPAVNNTNRYSIYTYKFGKEAK